MTTTPERYTDGRVGYARADAGGDVAFRALVHPAEADELTAEGWQPVYPRGFDVGRPGLSLDEALTQVDEWYGSTCLTVLRDDTGDWAVALAFGQEAPDSPMNGGVAYGLSPDLATALRAAFNDLGVELRLGRD